MTDISALAAVSEVPSPNESKIRSTKRKLHDAFEVLDGAVTTTAPSEKPPPPKRANTIRSLYSTLAKYGIKSGTKPVTPASTSSEVPNVKSTPHLTAILNRAATKTKSTFSFKFSAQPQPPAPLLPPTAEYRPSSLASFLSRLATYKLTTYANKPPSIDAVAASKCGWINDGKDRLVCGLCNSSWVVAGREGMNRDAANALIEKQRAALVEAHKNGCPWKTRQCEDSIYCVPLQSPAGMIKDIKIKATAMDPAIKDISIKYPLTAAQLSSLRDVLSAFTHQNMDISPRMYVDQPEASSTPPPPPPPATQPSETAILAALFGWSLVPPAAPESLRRSSTTRASSTTSVAPSPALSRASSVSLPRTPPKAARKSTELSFQIPSSLVQPKPENALLQCELCQRRLGLWAFTARPAVEESAESVERSVETVDADANASTPVSTRPKKALPRRSFDLLKEHRSYCPYVVRSTVVPSLPVPPTPAAPGKSSTNSTNGHASSLSVFQFNGKISTPGALEGWRAVLIVGLRYGMAQKQRIEYNFLAPKDPASDLAEGGDAMEVDNVKAMVTGVKTRGGKDLLKYVRGLLG